MKDIFINLVTFHILAAKKFKITLSKEKSIAAFVLFFFCLFLLQLNLYINGNNISIFIHICIYKVLKYLFDLIKRLY